MLWLLLIGVQVEDLDDFTVQDLRKDVIHYAQEAGMQPVARRFMLDRGRLTTRDVIVVSVTLMLNVLLPSWCSFLA